MISADILLGLLGLAATLLLVVVGLLNFSVFRKQLRIAQEQIDTAVRHLAVTQKQPDLHLIQRAIAETSDHLHFIVERPWLRPYFYEGAEWKEGDRGTADEVKAMGELMLNNFASALMHSAAFPQYPVRGIDRNIMFHLRSSPALRGLLMEMFDRFPFTGLSLLCFKNDSADAVCADLESLIAAEGIDATEMQRRRDLLQIYQQSENRSAIEFTTLSMQQRQ